MADIFVQGVAHVIFREVIIDRLAVLFDLDDVLATLGFVHGAFAANHVAGDGGGRGVVGQGREGRTRERESGDEREG